jgi:hypothetical protein
VIWFTLPARGKSFGLLRRDCATGKHLRCRCVRLYTYICDVGCTRSICMDLAVANIWLNKSTHLQPPELLARMVDPAQSRAPTRLHMETNTERRPPVRPAAHPRRRLSLDQTPREGKHACRNPTHVRIARTPLMRSHHPSPLHAVAPPIFATPLRPRRRPPQTSPGPTSPTLSVLVAGRIRRADRPRPNACAPPICRAPWVSRKMKPAPGNVSSL